MAIISKPSIHKVFDDEDQDKGAKPKPKRGRKLNKPVMSDSTKVVPGDSTKVVPDTTKLDTAKSIKADTASFKADTAKVPVDSTIQRDTTRITSKKGSNDYVPMDMKAVESMVMNLAMVNGVHDPDRFTRLMQHASSIFNMPKLAPKSADLATANEAIKPAAKVNKPAKKVNKPSWQSNLRAAQKDKSSPFHGYKYDQKRNEKLKADGALLARARAEELLYDK
jgi:hypothetical protein